MKRKSALRVVLLSMRNLLGKPETLPLGVASGNGKGRGYPRLIPEKCLGCGLCSRSCPPGAISMRSVGKKLVGGKEVDKMAPGFDYYRCIYCGLCADVCPAKAIEMVRRQPIEAVAGAALLAPSLDPRLGALLAFASIFAVSLAVYVLAGLFAAKGRHSEAAYEAFTGGVAAAPNWEKYYIPGIFSFVLFFLVVEALAFLVVLKQSLPVLLLAVGVLLAVLVEGARLLKAG